jgi:hypothetical protein
MPTRTGRTTDGDRRIGSNDRWTARETLAAADDLGKPVDRMDARFCRSPAAVVRLRELPAQYEHHEIEVRDRAISPDRRRGPWPDQVRVLPQPGRVRR